MLDFFWQELNYQRSSIADRWDDEDAAKDCLLHLKGAALLTGFTGAEARVEQLLEREYSSPSELLPELDSLTEIASGEVSNEDVISEAEQAPSAATSDPVGLEFFLAETERQRSILLKGLLDLTQGKGSSQLLESMMRAAHSLKGASAIVGLEGLVPLAHNVEDRLVAFQQGQPIGNTDALFEAVEFFEELENFENFERASSFLNESAARIAGLVGALRSEPSGEMVRSVQEIGSQTSGPTPEKSVLRLDTSFLDDLLSVAGRLKVNTFSLSLALERVRVLKGLEVQIAEHLNRHQDISPELRFCFNAFSRLTDELGQRVCELDTFENGLYRLSRGLTEQVVRARMRPFSELSGKLKRRVRKLERDLKKAVDVEVLGENTPVDREILQRLEPALGHIITNSIDHGIESPAERLEKGKDERGLIRLEARHSGGSFELVVEDDGRGVDPECLRKKLVEQGLVSSDQAAELSESELGDFLLRPRFSTKTEVSEHSGRGVGLDIVREVVVGSGGHLALKLRPDRGLRFEITLPVTLSTTRVLVFRIGQQLFALALTQLTQVLKLEASEVFLTPEGAAARSGRHQILLSRGDEVLEIRERLRMGDEIQTLVLRAGHQSYGLMVDEFVGHQDLIIQKLPALLGKVADVSATAQLDDGRFVFILEPEELLTSMGLRVWHGPEDAEEVRASA